jgi:hypothetical protein
MRNFMQHLAALLLMVCFSANALETPQEEGRGTRGLDVLDVSGIDQTPEPKATIGDHRGLVYVRQNRDTTRVSSEIEEGANWQHTQGVKRIIKGITVSDIYWDQLDDRFDPVRLTDCEGNPNVLCTAIGPRVSPDGKKVIFFKGYGNWWNYIVAPNGVRIASTEIDTIIRSELVIYHFPTSDAPFGWFTTVPNTGTHIDMQPFWVDNDTILFISNRQGTWPFKAQYTWHEDPNQCNSPCTNPNYGQEYWHESFHVWMMDIDGENAKNLTPHAQMTAAPTYTSDGRIFWAEWVAQGQNAYKSTPANFWWIGASDGLGRDQTFILNAHNAPPLKTRDWLDPTLINGGEGSSSFKALRCQAEIERGRFAFANYYRGNHLGCMGVIYETKVLDHHVEGCLKDTCLDYPVFTSGRDGSGRFTPSDLVAVTPYGQDQDMRVRFYIDGPNAGRPVGKAGYPAPFYENGSFIITHARGNCYEVTQPQDANRQAMGGEPTCQKGIWKVSTTPVTDPYAQMTPLVDDERYHVFDAWPVAPYSELYGQLAPAPLPEPDPEGQCVLNVVDARKAEILPSQQLNEYNEYLACKLQGCKVEPNNPNYVQDNIELLTIYTVENWDTFNSKKYENTMNNTGFMSTTLYRDFPLKADGSVSAIVPCETPLKIVGSNAQGMVVAHDDALHSLRSGETRTCHGCHDGHSEERAVQFFELEGAEEEPSLWNSFSALFAGDPVVKETAISEPVMPQLKYVSASERFVGTEAYNEGPSTGCPAGCDEELCTERQYLFYQDVHPILQDNCFSCHKSWDNPTSYSTITWYPDKISRPCTSDLVCKFALNSPLYTHCMGVEGHPGVEDKSVCQTIGKWIDTGAQNRDFGSN